MDHHEQMHLAAVARHQDAVVARNRLRAECRRRLARIVATKHRTTLIGSLSRFEECFGALWGHGLDETELTETQRMWREVWQRCRTGVLDNGNQQLRALEKELEQYEVEWLRYRAVLPMRGDS